jgi:hypothetical protein
MEDSAWTPLHYLAIFIGNVDSQIPSHDIPHVHSHGIVPACFTRADGWLDGLNLKICFVSCGAGIARVERRSFRTR